MAFSRSVVTYLSRGVLFDKSLTLSSQQQFSSREKRRKRQKRSLEWRLHVYRHTSSKVSKVILFTMLIPFI